MIGVDSGQRLGDNSWMIGSTMMSLLLAISFLRYFSLQEIEICHLENHLAKTMC